MQQNYVSNELTHFVGRNQATDEARYELLLQIVAGGRLLDPSHVGKRHPVFRAFVVDRETGKTDGVQYSSFPSVRHDPNASLADNGLIQFEIVCFCDIPFDQLAIHRSKYSSFGLSFSKSFLVAQGAGPVMYVPASGELTLRIFEHHITSGSLFFEEEKRIPREHAYDGLFGRHNAIGLEKYQSLQRCVEIATNSGDHADVDDAVQQLRTMLIYQTCIEAFMFGFLKFFDPALPPEHPDNFYMEREWRVAGQVNFAKPDLAHIIVPEAFAERARADLPELCDRVIGIA